MRRVADDNRAMGDTTVISVVAIVVAGIGGPAITSMATTRGQRRKFGHERALHDIDEVRRLLDETGAALNEVIRHCAGVGSLIHQLGIGRAAGAVLDELEEKIEEFEATSARLTIRCGPRHEVAEVCSKLVAAVDQIEGELTYLGALIPRVNSARNTEAEREQLSAQFLDAIQKVRREADALRKIRPAYVLAAHTLAGSKLATSP